MKKLPPIVALFVIALAAAVPAAAQTPRFRELRPGTSTSYQQEVPVKIALVGFDEADVDESALLAQLPATYTPAVRAPLFYGTPGRELGLRYEFEYDIINTGNEFEDKFFDYLAEIGTEGPATPYQQAYSGTLPPRADGTPHPLNQTGSVLDIDRSLYIDAPSVENWLATQGREMLDTDEENAYFLYLVNWYSDRDDFQFHVYTKMDEPDPDTDYNFGERRANRSLIAWGGENSRTWFFDISAGPEAWSGSYNINDEDLDGDQQPDYRIPPIWEYTEGGYRMYPELSRDLGLLTRYVAINLLFTSSPIYDPLVTTPGTDGRKVVHVEVIQAAPNENGLDYTDREFILSKLADLQPYYEWEVVVEETPIDPGIQHALDVFLEVTPPTAEDTCVNEIGSAFAALFCYFRDNRDTYIPAYNPNDYVLEVYAISQGAEGEDLIPFLGLADDDWTTGAPSYIYEFVSPSIRAAGYGLTTTTVHEVGHAVGVSHPHDGYDAETGINYGPTGPFFFAWSGDEHNSTMSYIDLNWDFSQFDRDNVYRWEMAGYLNKSNALLADILADPEASEVYSQLFEAEQDARDARRDFEQWNYLAAVEHAYSAFNKLRAAAEQIGVPVEPVTNLNVAPYNPDVPRYVDPIRRGMR